MSRVIYQPTELLTADLLATQQVFDMQAIGVVAQGVAGGETGVVGLECTPTSPASLSVQIAPGGVIYEAQTDATQFGPLPANTSPVFKVATMGTLATLTLAGPSGSGQSINYLIQASGSEIDDTPVINQYYNSANPTTPYAGQNNSGAADLTVRDTIASVAVVPGVAATTGTQATPAVGAGYVGLYVITVSSGQTTITQDQIVKDPGAPFIADKYNSFLTSDALANVVTQAELAADLVPYATQAYVQQAVGGINTTGPDLSGYATNAGVANTYAPIQSAALQNPTTTTPPTGDNSTKIPNTSWVEALVTSATSGLASSSSQANYLTGSESVNATGWLKIGGITMQWGYNTGPFQEDNTSQVTFAIPFTAGIFNIQMTNDISAASGNADSWMQVIDSSKTLAGFTAYVQGSSSGATAGFSWFVIGT